MRKYDIAAYYFPNYHTDPLNEYWHGKRWDEWQLVKHAQPRFPSHRQPRIPQWGYEDESLPHVMNKKIRAASESGISAFIFDWYWYDEGPYLLHALEEGFLKADSRSALKFALMWANHDWVDIHPAQRSIPHNVLRSGRIKPETFSAATQYIIDHYFILPNYLKVNGGLYFSIYDITRFIESFGTELAAAGALEDFRLRTSKSCGGELHLNAVIWNQMLLPGDGQELKNIESVIHRLGFDSVTHYVWLHHQRLDGFPFTDYATYRDRACKDWQYYQNLFKLPYYPNITVGWDSSPRTIQSDVYENLEYPFLPILVNNTPVEFARALRLGREFLEKHNAPLLTINAWNEWTEGSYLEPDTEFGNGYLDAIRDVFLP